jgi:hypothetical protein
MGYGGVMLGYTLLPHQLLHATFTGLVGGGGLGARLRMNRDSNIDLADAFFVFEPMLTVDLNVARHFRLGASLSYRLVRGVQTDGLSNADLSGLFGSMVFKFGKF